MSAYSGTPLPKKLGIKDSFRIAFINAPKNFQSQLGLLPPSVSVVTRLTKLMDLILVFVERESVLVRKFPVLAKRLSSAGILWIAWPKKTAGVVTDLSFDKVQRIGLSYGMVDVKICAIDEVWSGLKFVYRLKDRAELDCTQPSKLKRVARRQ